MGGFPIRSGPNSDLLRCTMHSHVLLAEVDTVLQDLQYCKRSNFAPLYKVDDSERVILRQA